ncbi:hypothetical protein RRG08_027955 [Elysia crispata]|uniref:Uncharacterized protein n=1 Tax=Elysia crispata TaxID=231223 RepID=A0AAE0ZL56_9GAST|nr:hypothetical protein RRG08_027955 [Elysia crispata]
MHLKSEAFRERVAQQRQPAPPPLSRQVVLTSAAAAATSSTTIIKTSSFDISSSGFNIRLNITMNKVLATIFVSLAVLHVVFCSKHKACTQDSATPNGNPCDGQVQVTDDLTGSNWCCPADGEKVRYQNGADVFECTCRTDAECAVPNSPCAGLETAE